MSGRGGSDPVRSIENLARIARDSRRGPCGCAPTRPESFPHDGCRVSIFALPQQPMAFITLRRSRNTNSYYLVESYRDEEGRSRKRTLCYLGREQDGTDTLAKAL
jgi:hypothetical protein